MTWRQVPALLVAVVCFLLLVGCGAQNDQACDPECSGLEQCEQGMCRCLSPYTSCNGSCIDTSKNVKHCGKCGNACGDDEACVSGACFACSEQETLCDGLCVNLNTSSQNCGSCGNVCDSGKGCKEGSCVERSNCSKGKTLCGSSCFDLQTSSSHCGACDTICPPNFACVAGQCGCTRQGFSTCGGACVNLQSSNAHCGSCGSPCPKGQACNAGKCECFGSQVVCNGACADTQTDVQHCGGCGQACKVGEVCLNGQCECPSTFSRCGGSCTDTQTSPQHCGACGQSCQTGQACTQGKCGCATGQSQCSGSCVDTDSSSSHCGACGTACSGGQTCEKGKCTCPRGQTLCQGTCVDLQTSTEHCGSCNKACAAGATCGQGACKVSCASPKVVCDGKCVDTQASTQHCGACNKACPSGQSCNQGACQQNCKASQKLCNGVCTDVQTDTDHCGSCGNKCASQKLCVSGTCSCPTGKSDCSGACVDLTNDVNHCGACGTTCGAGEACQQGKCECAGATTLCGGVCVDTQSSTSHCGRCGNVCGSGQSCNAGKCECTGGLTLCGTTCVDTKTSNANCGACNKACGAGQVCTNGTCECTGGKTLCGTTCVDTQTSAAHCGSCNKICSAGQACSNGTCGCSGGKTLCGTTCVDTQTSNTDCGSCGNACGSGQTCNAGKCSCSGGLALCNNTCVDTKTSNQHCGACGTVCGNGQSCQNGQCSCGSGLTLCGSSCVDTKTSSQHCGSCGNTCGTGLACQNGTCGCSGGLKVCGTSCVDIQTSTTHCGACNNACASGQTCSSGQCSCGSGLSLCGSACVNTMTSSTNCGGCGTVCPGGQACTNGSCGCPSGQTACSGQCVDLQTSASHCGACGTACSSGQSCQSGQCKCGVGQTLCQGSCVNTQSSATHCGGCGKTCSSGQVCVNGACQTTTNCGDQGCNFALPVRGDIIKPSIFGMGVDSKENVVILHEVVSSSGSPFGSNVLQKGFYISSANSSGTWRWHAAIPSIAVASWHQKMFTTTQGDTYLLGKYSGSVTFGTTKLTAPSGQRWFLARVNAQGQWELALDLGTTQGVEMKDVEAQGQSLFLVGHFATSLQLGTFSLTNSSGKRAFVGRLNPSQSWVWVKSNGNGVESYDQVRMTSSGGFVAYGRYSTGGRVDRYDANGSLQWSSNIKDTVDSQGFRYPIVLLSLALSPNDNVYVYWNELKGSNGFNHYEYKWITKVSSLGVEEWSIREPKGYSGDRRFTTFKTERAIGVDANENVSVLTNYNKTINTCEWYQYDAASLAAKTIKIVDSWEVNEYCLPFLLRAKNKGFYIGIYGAKPNLKRATSPTDPFGEDELRSMKVSKEVVYDIQAFDRNVVVKVGCKTDAFVTCNNACTDTAKDRKNCGGCGVVCKDNEACDGGTCTARCSPGQGTVCTFSTCTDLNKDNQHCGQCGYSCNNGSTQAVCQSGKCLCPGGLLSCNGTCVDSTTSSTHCGSCGNACTATGSVFNGGEECRESQCVCKYVGFKACNNVCLDVNTDNNNCGTCGNVCKSGSTCQYGNCTCTSKSCSKLWSIESSSGTTNALNGVRSVLLDSSGNVYVSSLIPSQSTLGGKTYSATNGNFVVGKLSPTGQWLWVNQVKARDLYLAFDSSGGAPQGSVHVFGSSDQTNTFRTTTLSGNSTFNNHYFFRAMVKPDGTWSAAFQSDLPDALNIEDVSIHSSGNVFVSGSSSSPVQVSSSTVNYQISGGFTFKFDPQMKLQWSYGENAYIGATSTGGVVLARSGYYLGQTGGFVRWLDANGQVVWSKDRFKQAQFSIIIEDVSVDKNDVISLFAGTDTYGLIDEKIFFWDQAIRPHAALIQFDSNGKWIRGLGLRGNSAKPFGRQFDVDESGGFSFVLGNANPYTWKRVDSNLKTLQSLTLTKLYNPVSRGNLSVLFDQTSLHYYRCPSANLYCGSSCVDSATSNSHCGACGNACTNGKSCQQGVCQ